jgi:hypothetical protein
MVQQPKLLVCDSSAPAGSACAARDPTHVSRECRCELRRASVGQS